MTVEQEKDLAESVLKTRCWGFSAAWPVIAQTVRRIVTQDEERHRGADRMIRDYRRIIAEAEYDK